MPEQDSSSGIVYPASDAAQMLGVSSSALRRYGALYEQLHGDLPRDGQQRRLWTPDALNAVQAAKAMLEAGEARSIGAALELLEGAPDALTSAAAPAQATRQGDALNRLGAALEALGRLENEVQQLRRQLAEPDARVELLEQSNDDLRQANADLRAALENERAAKNRRTNPLGSAARRFVEWLSGK